MKRSRLLSDPLMIAYHQLQKRALRLPFSTVSKEDLVTMGARLIPGGGLIIEQVAKGLIAEPEFFPEMPGKGEELLGRQKVADSWQALFHLFSYLADRSWQSYVLQQSELNAEGQRILSAIRTESQLPYSRSTHRWRLRRVMAVAGAFILAEGYYKQLHRTRAVLSAARKQARDEATQKLGIQPSPPLPKTRQKLRAERALTDGIDRLIADGFTRVLKEMNARMRALRHKTRVRRAQD